MANHRRRWVLKRNQHIQINRGCLICLNERKRQWCFVGFLLAKTVRVLPLTIWKSTTLNKIQERHRRRRRTAAEILIIVSAKFFAILLNNLKFINCNLRLCIVFVWRPVINMGKGKIY